MRNVREIYRRQGWIGIAGAVLRKISLQKTDVRRGPVQSAWTEYLAWLSLANAGMLQRGNVDCMDYAIAHLPGPAPIVEIGSFCGLSANVLTYLKEKHNVTNPLITCDNWTFEGAERGDLGDSKTMTYEQYREFVRDSFIRNVQTFSGADLPFAIEAASDEFFKAWEAAEARPDVFGRVYRLGGPISFCYIDGNHSYEFARRDFENCDRYLEKGGFILFDDSADGSGWDVCRVVREVAATRRYELIAKNPNYFFRKYGGLS